MTGLLTEMAQTSLARFEAARAREPERELWARAADAPPAPPLKLCSEGFDIIAECKLHSPSAGELSSSLSIQERIGAYAQGGAAAVSVLTEPLRFGGHLDHLRQAAAILRPYGVPAMRKDFLVEPYQVMEARAEGAGGVLVIVRMLDQTRIKALLDCAAMLKMFVLLEAFDEAELEIAGDILHARRDHTEQVLVGLNCRDLEKLTVDFGRLEELASVLPPGYPHVAESGVFTPDDAMRVADLGYSLALIGTSLMKAPDPRKLLGELLRVGREHALARVANSER
ncbi:MAG TPA: indole-3-glycerol-phosphate synthase [Steroidobacteraceae bacterium]|nr:indole-3-glycerol-phosphate synthase [Steroidobacteraceae bacterium]